MTKQYGKLAPIHFDGLGTIESYLTTTLAPAPAEVKPPGIENWPTCVEQQNAPSSRIAWGMLGNGPDSTVTFQGDGFDAEKGCGDCTVAGYAHADEALTWDEAEHEAKHAITGNEAVGEYFTLTGGVDSGLVCGGVLMKGYNEGLFGAKNLGFGELAGTIDSINFGLLDQVINSFGVAYIGINCPESAEQQFDENLIWTPVADSPIAGGHCIILVGYTTVNGVKVYAAVTWGQVVFISEAFLREYMDEAWAVLMPAIAQRDELKKVSLLALQADLSNIAPGYHNATSGTDLTVLPGFISKFEHDIQRIYDAVPDEVKGFVKEMHKVVDAAMERESVDLLVAIFKDALKTYFKHEL